MLEFSFLLHRFLWSLTYTNTYEIFPYTYTVHNIYNLLKVALNIYDNRKHFDFVHTLHKAITHLATKDFFFILHQQKYRMLANIIWRIILIYEA